MARKVTSTATLALLAVAVLAGSGCQTAMGPALGGLGIPIPISPYFQKKKEDEHWMQERYNRVAILQPIGEGGQAIGLDPPSDDQVMRLIEEIHPTAKGLPLLHEVQISNVRIVKEKTLDRLDETRVVPLIGPVQLHHVHYKCTVYFTKTTRVGWPLPHTLVDEDVVEVVYIDRDHFHMAGNVLGNGG